MTHTLLTRKINNRLITSQTFLSKSNKEFHAYNTYKCKVRPLPPLQHYSVICTFYFYANNIGSCGWGPACRDRLSHPRLVCHCHYFNRYKRISCQAHKLESFQQANLTIANQPKQDFLSWKETPISVTRHKVYSPNMSWSKSIYFASPIRFG